MKVKVFGVGGAIEEFDEVEEVGNTDDGILALLERGIEE